MKIPRLIIFDIILHSTFEFSVTLILFKMNKFPIGTVYLKAVIFHLNLTTPAIFILQDQDRI